MAKSVAITIRRLMTTFDFPCILVVRMQSRLSKRNLFQYTRASLVIEHIRDVATTSFECFALPHRTCANSQPNIMADATSFNGFHVSEACFASVVFRMASRSEGRNILENILQCGSLFQYDNTGVEPHSHRETKAQTERNMQCFNSNSQ